MLLLQPIDTVQYELSESSRSDGSVRVFENIFSKISHTNGSQVQDPSTFTGGLPPPARAVYSLFFTLFYSESFRFGLGAWNRKKRTQVKYFSVNIEFNIFLNLSRIGKVYYN